MVTEHLIIGMFDPDLFIGDLVEQRSNYCSSFLVNAVLCYAMVCLGRENRFWKTLTRISNRSLRYALILLPLDSISSPQAQDYGDHIKGLSRY